MVASDITTQPKQGRQAAQMSSLCILLCLWLYVIGSCKNLLNVFVIRLSTFAAFALTGIFVDKNASNVANGNGPLDFSLIVHVDAPDVIRVADLSPML